MRRRWLELARAVKTAHAPAWASPLGQRPADPDGGALWVAAVTAVAAYRERYELPDHTRMLGDRPSDLRPDAQAAYDHARSVADRLLARHLDHLDLDQLRELDARQQVIIDARPRFDPAQLAAAHQALDEADRVERVERVAPPDGRRQAAAIRARAARRVAHLERQAEVRDAWQAAAGEAVQVRRRIALAIDQRRRTRRLVRR
jgi:hypothetical protein